MIVSMSVFLSLQLNKPLLVEGPAGVGKTEIEGDGSSLKIQTWYQCTPT
jgi:hypothetical protein